MQDKKMPLSEHFADLQKTLLNSLLYCFFASVLLSFFHKELLIAFQKPLNNVGITALNVLSPQEGFLIPIKLVLMCGLIVATPLIVREVTLFAWPALRQNEKQILQTFLIPRFLIALVGAFFAWQVLIPISIEFLLKATTNNNLQATWTLQYWFVFVQSMLIASVAAFQLPIVMGVLAKFGLIDSHTVREKGPHAIVGLLILSGFITPPDVVTQIIIAIPLILLFYFSIFIVKANED